MGTETDHPVGIHGMGCRRRVDGLCRPIDCIHGIGHRIGFCHQTVHCRGVRQMGHRGDEIRRQTVHCRGVRGMGHQVDEILRQTVHCRGVRGMGHRVDEADLAPAVLAVYLNWTPHSCQL